MIEYTHDDPNRPGAGRQHRPIADVLNPADLPAIEAHPTYHERWEHELALDEIKTQLSGRAVTNRGETPEGAT